jgi:hypothetical protein
MKTLRYLIICSLLAFISCKKLIEVPSPQNQLTTDKVFSDTTSATAAMINVYSIFEKNIDPNYNSYMGIYTDELTHPGSGTDNAEFTSSKLSSMNGTTSTFWSWNYSVIYACNLIIQQVNNSKALPVTTANRLTAESKFLRAYSYFYLVNSFGPVPLILTTDVNVTSKATRTDTPAVYSQIVKDLQDASGILPESYPNGDKVRANKWSAAALLSRVYLYQRNWKDAEAQATAVINSGAYSLSAIPDVYLANSSETIMAFRTQNGYVTEAPSLIPSSGPPSYPVTNSLVSAFENGDLRKSNWIRPFVTTSNGTPDTVYYPYKYHNRGTNTGTPEYLVALRLAELYLIRTEAHARQGNLNDAIADLNIIRNRAGLAAFPSSSSQTDILNAISKEWRVEFCLEWAHRFLELKRSGSINVVMGAYKSTWLPQADLLPIPKNELTYDSNLTQNPGY